MENTGELPQAKDTEDNFQRSLKALYLEYFNEVPDSRLSFGPVFRSKTSKGIPLRLRTVFTKPTGTLPIKGEASINRGVVIFAQNDQGEVVGVRDISFTNNLDYLDARGNIFTAKRGLGIASQLELATKYTLRAIASHEYKPICWIVENGNLIRLRQGKDMYGGSDKPEDISHLEALRNEQAAWEKLYGDQGTVGFTRLEQRIFPLSDLKHINLEAIDTADIGDWVEERGKREIMLPVIRNVVGGEQEDLQRAKLAEFKTQILPIFQDFT